MTLLETIRGPRDLKDVRAEDLPQLAAEIRDVLIATVTRTGGHLGPNLGVVELTMALHRVFESPADRIVFDTGHQSYVHKLLTGRYGEFDTLRQRGGLSGYPSRAESEHDVIENSHASTSLSYADGLAKAYQIRGESDRCVVAVIGDGALTGGMAWEALNNIAGAKDRRVVIVINDNGRSYQPTIGGLADHLATVRTSPRYEQVLDYIKTTVSGAPLFGSPLFGTLHGIKKGIKDVLQPQVLFEDLGLKYLGPVDGHDEQAVEAALARARDFGGPVLVHVITRKGFGYPLAEQNDEDCLHQVGPAAKPSAVPGRPGPAVDPDLRRRAGRHRSGPARRGRRHRGHAAPHRPGRVRGRLPGAGVRRRHRRAARRDQRRRAGHGRPAPGRGHLLHVPEPRLRPGRDGRRPAQAAGHVRAGPGRGDRSRRGQPPRHVGPVAAGARAGHAGGRAARQHPAGRAAARGAGRIRRPDRAALPARQRPRRHAGRGPARLDGRAAGSRPATPATCCWSGSGRWPASAPRWPTGWPTRASA